MKENWKQILTWVGLIEGQYVNDPQDPGGPTNMGITQHTYDAWLGHHRNVKLITRFQASKILKKQYHDVVKGDDLPSGLDYAVDDFAINSGPAQAVTSLQRQLGVPADGIMGVHTLNAVKNIKDVPAFISTYCDNRLLFMKRLKVWRRFGKGWEKRVMGKYHGIQSTDIGVIDRAVMLAKGHSNIPSPTLVVRGKAIGPNSPIISLTDAIKNPQAITAVGGALGSVAAVASGSGPVQYALAAVLVLAAIAGIILLVQKGKI